MSAQRYRVVGSYWLSRWPLDGAGAMAEVDGTVRAGHAVGAVSAVGQVIVFGDQRAPYQPWELEVFDEVGDLVLRYVEGVPK